MSTAISTWTPVLYLQERLFNIIDASIPNKAQNSAIKGLVASAVNDCMNQIADGKMFMDKGQGKNQAQEKTPEPEATAYGGKLSIIP
jgi:hypothetical protein